MNLNFYNAPYRKVEPERRLENGGLIREAIVWGDNNTRLTEQETINFWRSKPRRTPLAAMLAKLINESSFKPYIARFEKGRLLNDPKWPYKTEFLSTSFGLFQFMGFHLTGPYAVRDQNNVFESFTIDKQFDLFDDHFSLLMATAKRMFPIAGDDEIIYKSFCGYQGDFTPDPGSSIVILAGKNYKTYLEKKKPMKV